MKLHWLLYVLLLLTLGVGQTARKLVTDTGGVLSQFGPLVLSLVVVLGLVAACLNKPVLRCWVWQSVSWVLIAGAVGLVVFALYLVVSGAPWVIVALPVMSVLLLMPALQKLFVYAFKSPRVWAGLGDEKSES